MLALLYKLVGVVELGITESKCRTQVLRTNSPVTLCSIKGSLSNIDGDGHENVT